jgi:lipoprotein-anchoring transpeptidase ErfK/SrfK
MRVWWRIAAAFALLAAVLGGLLIYDATRADRVARGVHAGDLDIGGLTRGDARRAVEARFGRAVAQPVVVTWRHRRFSLTAAASGVRIDAATTVARAIARSRAGNPFGRALRELGGGEVHARIAPVVRWSPEAVARFARAVAARVDRRARNADIDFEGARLVRRHARDGLGLRRARLRAAVDARLRSPARNTAIAAPVAVTHRPDRTLAELIRRYPRVITINRAKKLLRYYRRLRISDTFRIAVGQIGHKTPAGRYEVQSMQKNPAWHVPDEAWAGDLAGRVIPPGDPQNPLKARWMGFHDGAGIHGTSDIASLGAAASHGCIRMAVPDVIRLYRGVRVGTPVFIV